MAESKLSTRGLVGDAERLVCDSGLLPLALLAPTTKQLADGTVGYGVRMPRADDCFQAAIATVLQVPIEDVPDPRIDERLRAGEHPNEITRSAWRDLCRWLESRDLHIVVHWTVPARRRRWIGVVPMRGEFNDHCLVMRHGEVLFDPVADMGPEALSPTGKRLSLFRRFTTEHVRSGFSFRAT